MSAAVRRMVCDIPLRWLPFAALLVLLIPVSDGLWLIHPDGRMPLITALSPGPLAISLAAIKLPTWRLLPVSRREIGHARWWLGVGGPLILLALSLALATVVVSLAGAIRATPADMLALAGGECVVGVGMQAMSLAGPGLRKAVGSTGTVVLLLPWAVLACALAVGPPSLSPGLRLALPVAGAIAIAVAIALYRIEPTFLLDLPMVRSVPAHRRAGRFSRPGQKGWFGLWRPFLGVTAFVTAVPAGLFLVLRLISHQAADPVPAAVGMTVLAMASLIFGGMVRTSARALRSLPASAAVLTSVLLCAAAAVQLIAFAALYLVCRLWHGPAAALLVLLPLVVGVGACGFAFMLRGWGRATVLLWLVLLPICDLFFDHPTFATPAMAAGVASLLGGWLWVYFELSRARSAFQPRAISVPSWRGR